jgi:hypothetical protein
VGYYPWGAAVRKSDGHLIFACWSAKDSATGDFRTFDITDGSTITEKTALATDKDDSYWAAVCVNPSNDHIYVAYNGKLDGTETLGTTTGIYYAKSEDGMATWASTDNAYSADTAAFQQVFTPHTGARFLVVWLNLDTNILLETNADNSVVLVASGGGARTHTFIMF